MRSDLATSIRPETLGANEGSRRTLSATVGSAAFSVGAFLADLGIDNAMEKNAAEKTATAREAELMALKAEKDCYGPSVGKRAEAPSGHRMFGHWQRVKPGQPKVRVGRQCLLEP